MLEIFAPRFPRFIDSLCAGLAGRISREAHGDDPIHLFKTYWPFTRSMMGSEVYVGYSGLNPYTGL